MRVPIPSGPAYPLSREEFRRALATGHGRAKIHVARFGAAEFHEEILEAARVCKVFDPQCEGTRADWLADLCLAAGVEREVVALPEPGEHWDRNHRAALLKELAVRGVSGAREALYACFGRVDESSDLYGGDEILALDGEAGLLFLARALGADLDRSVSFFPSDHELMVFDAVHGEGAGRKRLEVAALTDAGIRAYLRCLDASKTTDGGAGPHAPPRQNVREVWDSIVCSGSPQYWLGGWSRSASREELEFLLEELQALSQPIALANALRCLGGSTLPPLHPRIFALTRHGDDDVRYWAARVLSRHSLPGVRTCGLEALARGDLIVALEILTRSAQVDDIEALLAALRPLDDPDEQHGLGYGILELFEHSPEVRDARLALHVYERTPCMNCRETSVDLLVGRGEAPPWLLEECAFDADEDIRASAQAGRLRA